MTLAYFSAHHIMRLEVGLRGRLHLYCSALHCIALRCIEQARHQCILTRGDEALPLVRAARHQPQQVLRAEDGHARTTAACG